MDKLSKMDISRRVKYSRQQIIRIIKDFKDVEDFYLGEPIKYRMLEAHFIDGMSIMDISKELNINDSYIRRIINKYILNVLN
jgi:ribosome-binding protein aMBF1 (putative translation factor)